jgi:hypothetical protein
MGSARRPSQSANTDSSGRGGGRQPGVELILVAADEDTLPGREPVRLDHARRSRLVERGRGQDACSREHIFRKGLRALDSRGGSGRAERSDSGVAQLVRNSRDERRLRSDHREIDLERVCQPEQPLAVVRANRVALSERGDAWISGRGVQLLEERTLAELPGKRVLTSSRADDQHPHAPESCKPLGVFEARAGRAC